MVRKPLTTRIGLQRPVNTEQIIEVLLSVCGALILTIWGSLVYEIRKLRASAHALKNKMTAMAMIVSILCKKSGVEWEHFDMRSED